MADNNYVEGNSQADSYALTNPYACPSNFAKLKGIDKVDCCNYLASFQYAIASGGATTTITPLTGNASGDLNYYTVCVYDGKNRVCGQLDTANPTTPFVIDTSSLDAGASWCLEFSGAVGGSVGDAACDLEYQKEVGSPAAGAINGNTIPANWNNVSFVLNLTSTDDANFTGFPAAGLAVASGDTLDLSEYLATGTTLGSGKIYVFTLDAKKLGYNPQLASAPSYDAAVVASHTDDVSFPYSLSKTAKQVASAITLVTTVGVKSGDVSYPLSGDASNASSFTLSYEVA